LKGIKAWKVFTDTECGVVEERLSGIAISQIEERHSGVSTQLPTVIVRRDAPDGLVCPFAATPSLSVVNKISADSQNANVDRPDCLPTPPEEHYGTIYTQTSRRKSSIPPPVSLTGSATKCPIRLLDERSPEEVAEYFEEHKHEIPKSHEVCVRRFQSNSESIRQLDAKYGSLVNMIQGLGVKHQPLLPRNDDGEEMDAVSVQKVEIWADNVTEPLRGENAKKVPDDRRGHFDRPLKEVRVGESPSRPWGISVPDVAPVVSEYAGPMSPLEPPEMSAVSTPPKQDAETPSDNAHEAREAGQARMVFTGPVFIGYSPEQATMLMKECGFGEAPKPS